MNLRKPGMTILPFDMGNARYNPIDLPHIRGAYLEGYAARANDRVGNPFAPHTNESFQWWRGIEIV